MTDRIYLPVRCPGCSKMSVTSVSVREAEAAFERGRAILLQCVYDCSEWTATPADRERLKRLLAEHAIVSALPWLKLRASQPAQHRHT